MLLNRRAFLALSGASVAGACASARRAPSPAFALSDELSLLEARVGGRVGVFALNSGTGAHVEHRSDERFAMCSTFKCVLAAMILKEADRGALPLERALPFGQGDLLEYAPVTRARVAEGKLSIAELARAAVVVSDNTATNLLLAQVGGPAGLTRFCRELGDDVTRLDRNEPMLNTNRPGDERDTTSPRAMAGLLRVVLTGLTLSEASRGRLLHWMVECERGRNRLRAGLPRGWTVGDKTGTGKRGAHNDVAIVMPPGQAPWLIASYLSESRARPAELDAAHAEIARVVVAQLGS